MRLFVEDGLKYEYDFRCGRTRIADTDTRRRRAVGLFCDGNCTRIFRAPQRVDAESWKIITCLRVIEGNINIASAHDLQLPLFVSIANPEIDAERSTRVCFECRAAIVRHIRQPLQRK